MEIQLFNVRCFADPGSVRIAPLTLLVGENSTGKSSFLALTQIALDLVHGNEEPNFNQEPFLLGAYDQIAHYRGGRGGRARSFSIQITTKIQAPKELRADTRTIDATFSAEFKKRGSQPALESYEFSCSSYGLQLSPSSMTLATPSFSGPIPNEYLARMPLFRRGGSFFDVRYLTFMLLDTFRFRLSHLEDLEISEFDAEMLSNLWGRARGSLSMNPYPVAPVRTKPERTYNPVDDTRKSEGSHVSMVMAILRFTDQERWERVQLALEKFGQSSGMFREIALRILGKSDSDPFQIMVKLAGPFSNLIDVGYGVSQVLPVVVDLVNAEDDQLYLLQQPEIHLHPRAQAELGSFLGSVVSETRNYIVVETHSDYLIDRIRMDVRDGRGPRAEDVSILYFERDGLETRIYLLTLDNSGNLVGAPPAYRQFFMAEERRLLDLAE